MRGIASTLTVVAALAVGSQARADSLCAALDSIAAKSGYGFAALRGSQQPKGRTGPFDYYRAKIVLPEATACRVVVPPAIRGFGRPTFDCDIASADPPQPRMTRLIFHIARCVGAQVADHPPFNIDADGPNFDFTAGKLNYDISASRKRDGIWDIDLSIGPPSP